VAAYSGGKLTTYQKDQPPGKTYAFRVAAQTGEQETGRQVGRAMACCSPGGLMMADG
jgi:hypothetical protein